MTDPTPLERLYTIGEVARMLRIAPNSAYTFREKDHWPHLKVGAKLLFTEADWEAIKSIYHQTPKPADTPRTRRTRR